jgi:hypothetical protein
VHLPEDTFERDTAEQSVKETGATCKIVDDADALLARLQKKKTPEQAAFDAPDLVVMSTRDVPTLLPRIRK